MSTEDAGQDKASSRWEETIRLAQKARGLSSTPDAVTLIPFAADLETPEDDLSTLSPNGDQTDFSQAAGSLLNQARGKPGQNTGAIVLTDGRQSVRGDDNGARTALRARATEAPFYIIPLGGEVAPKDLEVRSSRRQFVAFAGQEVTVTAKVTATGLGAIRARIALEDNAGNLVGTEQTVELDDSQSADVRFVIQAPSPGVHLFRFVGPVWDGERVEANNRESFTLSVLDGETRIFMAEGAPYWDSKFLAQMIRQRKNMKITSVYRLAADRFFLVETGDARPSEATENIFPATAAELASYDLVVFGKGAEYFLDPERLGLLSQYVRDQGGAVLFTRGKPYSGRFEGLEFLEPVSWGESLGEPLRLQPTVEGEAAGLFGDLLPEAKDPVWDRLPEIAEAHQCLDMKPFTEILLEGRWQQDGRTQKVPALMSRRFGRGLVAMLNADGLWKWDFFPGEEENVEGQYEEFWSQLIQWAITYSEFLPGQDLSLHLDESIVYPGDPVRARIGHRGDIASGNAADATAANPAGPAPSLRIIRANGDPKDARSVPASLPSPQASRWEAAITLDEPGEYRVEAFDAEKPEAPGPSLPLTVLPLPSEQDQLSADPDFLATFAEASGGRVIGEADLPEIVASLDGGPATVDLAKAVWQPAWDRGWILAILLFLASLEWFTRRRSGLL